MIVETTLTGYKVRFSSVQNYSHGKASISCYSDDRRTRLLIIFQSESEEVGTTRIDNLPTGLVRVVVYFPISMFRSIYHTLQTEKPIGLYAFRSEHPFSDGYTEVYFGTRSGSFEPVGEEEDGGFWP